MNRRSLFALAIATFGLTLPFAPATAPARADEANLTGTWKSSFTRQNGDTVEITYKLKQEGEKLTGTITGPGGNETEVKDGKVKDGKVTFTVVRERDGQSFTSKYQGTPSGDTIKGKMSFEINGESRERDWEAKRSSN